MLIIRPKYSVARISAGIPLVGRGLLVPRGLFHGVSASDLPIEAQNPR